MVRRATLQDVANAAGVSYATADRVVNARGKVAEKSRVKVEQAIRALDYVRDERAANLARSRSYRFRFLLPDGPNAFFQSIKDALTDRRSELLAQRVEIDVERFRPFDPGALATLLEQIDPDRVDGIAVVASEAEDIAARLDQLRKRGVSVVTLVADTREGARDVYVGLDNHAAGRLAARLVAFAHRQGAGRVLAIVGTKAAPDHAARLAGFDAALAQFAPHLDRLATRSSADDPVEVERLVQAATAPGSTITAIYNAGAGNRGLLRALEAREGPRPAIVVHELTQATHLACLTGLVDAVIDQKPEEEVDRALSYLRALADARPITPTRLTPAIYMQDNLPDAPNMQRKHP